ncbi:MAG: methyl-accepting chemotaxis protein [Motiliproteus sp.]|jgi:methyl-accepting chemotaxis protein
MLSKLTIAQRVWLLAILSMTLFASTYMFQTFQKRDDLLDARKDRLVRLVETAHSVMVGFNQRAEEAELSVQQAQAGAIAVIRTLRYDSGQYFWLNDMAPRILMHPLKPDLDGQEVGGLKDKKGKRLFSEFVRVVRDSGAGFVDYYWTKPSSEVSAPKLSYVKGFKPWGWVVGTGVYIDDIDVQFKQELTSHALILVVVLALLISLSWLISRSIIIPLRATAAAMHEIAAGEGDLTLRMSTEGNDELADLAVGFNGFVEKVQNTVLRMRVFGEQLSRSAYTMEQVTTQANQSLGTHQEETHQVAAAVHELSATVQEVAQNAAEAARSVQAVREQALDGQNVVQQSVSSINLLADSVNQAASNIQVLEAEVQNIGGILDVIRSIADQTNLLALNAAIEAARAGDQGRGFAVVADEVRSLAKRTQESTEQIQGMIEQLQQGANTAVKTIGNGSEQAQVSVGHAQRAGDSLAQITQDVLRVSDMNMQIASATEEQSATVEMINQNVSNINHAFIETASGAKQIAQSGVQLKSLAEELNQLLQQFKA